MEGQQSSFADYEEADRERLRSYRRILLETAFEDPNQSMQFDAILESDDRNMVRFMLAACFSLICEDALEPTPEDPLKLHLTEVGIRWAQGAKALRMANSAPGPVGLPIR